MLALDGHNMYLYQKIKKFFYIVLTREFGYKFLETISQQTAYSPKKCYTLLEKTILFFKLIY